MNLLKNITGYIVRVGRAILNRYESAWQRWGERSWLPQTYQDARLDADSSTRIELQRRHRYWVKNSDVVQRIRNLYIQFSVGPAGLQVVPNSDSEDWNHGKQHNWQAWSRNPSMDTNLDLGQLCIMWAGQLFDDGEFFILKTQRKEQLKGGGYRIVPAIRTIAANRVKTPDQMTAEERKTIWDGVKVDANGKPTHYYIFDDSGGFTIVPASDVIHKFKCREPGMLRGIPEGFCSMNVLHDFEDLHLLEMQAAKLAAELAVVETNPTGEFDSTASRRLSVKTQTQNHANQYVTKNSDTYYNLTMGAKRYALKTGDTIKNFQVDRPSIVQQEYWQFLVTRICNAYNVPKLLVFPFSLQGTVVRADLDICATAFRFNFEIVASALREIYEWQTNWAVQYDRTLDGDVPDNALECVIRPPRAPNVDIGYTAAALETELKVGTRTYQDVFAERQQDWRHQFRQAAESAAYLKQLAKEFSTGGIEVTADEIAQKIDPMAAAPDGSEAAPPDNVSKTEAANA